MRHRHKTILAILLTGSVARGDAIPGSDIDLRFILSPGEKKTFRSAFRHGILIEQSYADLATTQLNLQTNPMEVYAYLDGRILYDPNNILTNLKAQAQNIFETYTVSEKEQQKMIHWLQSAQMKIEAALAIHDLLKAAFLTSTVSWQILEGLWAANSKPMPPNGAVWAHLKDLSKGPDHTKETLKVLFTGETPQRIQTALDLIHWALASLTNQEQLH